MTKHTNIADPGAELLAEIEQFLLDHDMAPSTFSSLATPGDRHLVRRMRVNGASIKSANIVRVRQFMASYRPPVRARGNVRVAA